MTLAVGDVAPAFSLPDQNGSSVALSQFRGQRVVIYFYPKDDTPGCTKEACNFRDQCAQFSAHNIAVLGISKDNAASMMRHTFVVDGEGRIEKVYLKVKAETMADTILADLGLS